MKWMSNQKIRDDPLWDVTDLNPPFKRKRRGLRINAPSRKTPVGISRGWEIANHEERRSQAMKYSTPEIAVLSSALDSIQHVEKGEPMTLDSNGSGQYDATINAYEVDE
jgi:hypothetical protein